MDYELAATRDLAAGEEVTINYVVAPYFVGLPRSARPAWRRPSLRTKNLSVSWPEPSSTFTAPA